MCTDEVGEGAGRSPHGAGAGRGGGGRRFEKRSLADAVASLAPGMRVLVPPGCGEATALIDEILRQADRLSPLTLMGGLRLDRYPFSAPAFAGRIRFVTWHMSPWLGAAHRRGDAVFVPVRYFDAVRLFAAGGPWAPDAVLVHTAPPDRGEYLSLGVSAYCVPAARRAPLVIAQVNPRMPRTLGNGVLHRSQIDCWTEVDHPLREALPSRIGEVERRIGAHVADLVPDGAILQVGIGAVPQAVVEALTDKKELGVHSLLVEQMLPLLEAGVITNSRKRLHRGRMDIGEIMGTKRLFAFCHENRLINMEPSDFLHDPQVVAQLGRFVSVNAALEVDVLGQINAEAVDGRQLAGVGGQFDFVLAAMRAVGGRSIIALPSATPDGTVSRIVAALPAGAPVTTPRYLADVVVTEFGVASLRGKSDEARIKEMAAIAHPAFRDQLLGSGR